ncbi:MAG: hypothetical protein IKN98_09215 [Bacteroidales bacterium]|nr:hypothetical protein [Bacteroidales bacterium]
MSDNSANNKRIAKNTLLLYFRMLITMLVALYTSRVVLNCNYLKKFLYVLKNNKTLSLPFFSIT